jgi:hypothetical protein
MQGAVVIPFTDEEKIDWKKVKLCHARNTYGKDDRGCLVVSVMGGIAGDIGGRSKELWKSIREKENSGAKLNANEKALVEQFENCCHEGGKFQNAEMEKRATEVCHQDMLGEKYIFLCATCEEPYVNGKQYLWSQGKCKHCKKKEYFFKADWKLENNLPKPSLPDGVWLCKETKIKLIGHYGQKKRCGGCKKTHILVAGSSRVKFLRMN